MNGARMGLWVLLGLATASCQREKAPVESAEPAPLTEDQKQLAKWNWSAYSPDTKASLEQRATKPEQCTLRCTRGQNEIWTKEGCLATATDFAFVSDDCEHVVVLYEYPVQAEEWLKSVVAENFARGERARAYQAYEFTRDASKIDARRKHMRWLAGALGERGRAPRLRANGGGVDFETIDGVKHTLDFDDRIAAVPLDAGIPGLGSEPKR